MCSLNELPGHSVSLSVGSGVITADLSSLQATATGPPPGSSLAPAESSGTRRVSPGTLLHPRAQTWPSRPLGSGAWASGAPRGHGPRNSPERPGEPHSCTPGSCRGARPLLRASVLPDPAATSLPRLRSAPRSLGFGQPRRSFQGPEPSPFVAGVCRATGPDGRVARHPRQAFFCLFIPLRQNWGGGGRVEGHFGTTPTTEFKAESPPGRLGHSQGFLISVCFCSGPFEDLVAPSPLRVKGSHSGSLNRRGRIPSAEKHLEVPPDPERRVCPAELCGRGFPGRTEVWVGVHGAGQPNLSRVYFDFLNKNLLSPFLGRPGARRGHRTEGSGSGSEPQGSARGGGPSASPALVPPGAHRAGAEVSSSLVLLPGRLLSGSTGTHGPPRTPAEG